MPPNLQYYGTAVTLAPTSSAAVGMRPAAVVANANGAAPPHHHVYPIPAATIQQAGTLQVSLCSGRADQNMWTIYRKGGKLSSCMGHVRLLQNAC